MSEDTGRLGARVVSLTVLGLLLLAGVAYAVVLGRAGDTAPGGARVEGISIAGLTQGEAEATVADGLRDRERRPIQVTFGDGRDATVEPDKAGLSVDYARSVSDAMGGARWSPSRLWAVLTGGRDVSARVEVDDEAMQQQLDLLDRALGKRPIEGTVRFDTGKAVPVQSEPGLVVNRGTTRALLMRRFLHEGTQKVPTRVEDPEVTPEMVATAMREFGEPAMSGPVTLVLGGQSVQASPALFGKGLSMELQDGRLVPVVDGDAMIKALAPAMRTVGDQPQDARFVIRKGKPVLVPAKVGVQFDPRDLEAKFAEVAVRTGKERRLEVDGKATQPAFTTADAKALGIVRRVSTFTTNFPYAEYRNVNLPRAAELINGTILKPGETFSLNRTVGERTKANGFTEGYVVSDGIFQKDLGGGVSQIATTTFNAMFFAGLEDVQHKPHSVYIDRYPVGREATVAWPSVDLRFTNDTAHGVLITAQVRKSTPSRQGAATVSMYSTKTWDISAGTGPRTRITQPETRYLQTDDCEEFSGTQGFDIDVFRIFRRVGSSAVARKETFHTHYIAGDTVKCGKPPKQKRG